ncbi:MAG: hypothetical protein ABJE66_01135 [Deltaproteobacteria bacterium]
MTRSRVVAATSSDRGALVSAGRVDDGGNFYLGGGFSGQADLGLGTIDATSVMNIYAASYDAELTPRWVDVFDSPVATNQVQGMVLGADGVSITGPFQGMVEIGATKLASAGADDRFFVVLDPTTGAPLHAARYGSTDDDDKGGGIAITDDGTTFIGGGCNGGDFSFGGAVLGGMDRDPCLCGVSPSGTVVAQRRWADPRPGGLVALARVDSDLIASGYFTVSATFDSGILTSAGATDAFITRLAPDLSSRWIVQIASDGDDASSALATDADGAIYFAGSTTASTKLTVGGLSFAVDGGDGFVGKLDPDGTPRWARAIGGPLVDEAHSVTVHDGVVIVAGSFAGTMSLDGLELASAGDLDAFVAAFDADTGAALWAERFGGPLADSAHVVVAGTQQLYIAGYSTGTIDLGSTASDGSDGSDGMFIATQSF